MMPSSGRVYVVDDEEIVREALAFLLQSRGLQPELFPSGDAFLQALNQENGPASLAMEPACVLLDVRMPGASGQEVFATLKQRNLLGRLPVIFLTGHGDVPMAVSTLKAGAFDFVEKPCSDNELVDRIEKALAHASEQVISEQAQHSVQARLDSLTSRELEVMNLILAGKFNKVIADELGISMRTVEVHRARVLAKMGVRTAVELANLISTKS